MANHAAARKAIPQTHRRFNYHLSGCCCALCEDERIAIITAAYAPLEKAVKYSLNRSAEADYCGDHCPNSCHWCNLRAALRDVVGKEGNHA